MSKATQRATSRPALPSPSPSPPALQPRPHRGGAAGLGHGGGGLGLEGGDQHRFHCSEEVLSSGDEGRPLSGTVTVITIVIITNVVISIVVIIASSILKLKLDHHGQHVHLDPDGRTQQVCGVLLARAAGRV